MAATGMWDPEPSHPPAYLSAAQALAWQERQSASIVASVATSAMISFPVGPPLTPEQLAERQKANEEWEREERAERRRHREQLRRTAATLRALVGETILSADVHATVDMYEGAASVTLTTASGKRFRIDAATFGEYEIERSAPRLRKVKNDV